MSVWTDFGFRESPYGTAPIAGTPDGEFLLVGRDEALMDLEDALSSSALHPTIEGDNGVGKTSLVAVAGYRLKSRFISNKSNEALLPMGAPFQLTSGGTLADLSAKVYYRIADAFIEHHEVLAARGLSAPDVGAVQRWLQAPIFSSTGGGLQVMGVGGEMTRTSEPNTSDGFTHAGFQAIVTRWLHECFPTRQQGGFIAVIDNLELLETSQNARNLLGEMRDTILDLPGVRWVLCGARGIVRSGASSQRLEGRLAQPMELAPISDEDVALAVDRRTQLYRLSQDAVPPVGPKGFRHIYDILNHNLRNTLKYCEDFSFWLRKNRPSVPDADEYFRLLEVWLGLEAEKHADHTRLGKRAWEVFDLLAAKDGSVSPSEFADYGFNSYPAMRTHLQALEDNELVQSTTDQTDQRRKTIVMTARAWLVHYARTTVAT